MTMPRNDEPVVEARGLKKSFGATTALNGIDLRIDAGRIVGLIGPNGAGKTTALNAILGLTSHEGELRVLGRDPWGDRASLMRDVSFIADVAVLPRWIRVSQLLDYVAAVHPRFDRARADQFLEGTTIRRTNRVKELSKGMVAQLHLAIVMAIDARLLVLDEPTLGLDIIYRKRFYDSLLEDFFERDRTIILATHNVDEIEHVVTDVIFLDRGGVVLSATMDEVEARFREVRVHPDRVMQGRDLAPIHEREALGQRIMLFDGVAHDRLTALGEVRRPSVADLFLARVGGGDGTQETR
jgi:ABC-2 type transport system ATP-binding protein